MPDTPPRPTEPGKLVTGGANGLNGPGVLASDDPTNVTDVPPTSAKWSVYLRADASVVSCAMAPDHRVVASRG